MDERQVDVHTFGLNCLDSFLNIGVPRDAKRKAAFGVVRSGGETKLLAHRFRLETRGVDKAGRRWPFCCGCE